MKKHIFPKNRQFLKKRNMYKKSSCFGILFLYLAVHSGSFGQELLLKKGLQKIDSIILLHKIEQKKPWLNLLPNINYDFQNQSVNIGISLNTFSNFYQQKERNKIELAKYENSLKERLYNDLEKINLEIEKFKIEKIVLAYNFNLFKIDFDLFQISKGKYSNNEITSEDFLKLKKNYISKKNSLKTNVLKLKLKAFKIALKTKSDTLQVSLNILSNSINNYDQK
jgi:hypothetical protein